MRIPPFEGQFSPSRRSNTELGASAPAPGPDAKPASDASSHNRIASDIASGVEHAIILQALKADRNAPGPASHDIRRLDESLSDRARTELEGLLGPDRDRNQNSSDAIVDRISDLIIDGFSLFGGDAADDFESIVVRQRYVDLILPALERGYDEALETLGRLPDDVMEHVEQVVEQLYERVDEFVGEEDVPDPWEPPDGAQGELLDELA
jgi:hypothetical protein